jgi:hypothetical protein
MNEYIMNQEYIKFKFLFLGDFVDRWEFIIETVIIIFLLIEIISDKVFSSEKIMNLDLSQKMIIFIIKSWKLIHQKQENKHTTALLKFQIRCLFRQRLTQIFCVFMSVSLTYWLIHHI